MDAPKERLVKFVLVEALLNCTGLTADSHQMAQMAEIGGFKPTRPPKELAVEKYVAMLEWAAQRFFPAETLAVSLYNLGVAQYHSYAKTVLGRVQNAGAHSRSIERLIVAYIEGANHNSNFGTRRYEKLGERQYLLVYRGVPQPGEAMVGFMTAGLKAAGTDATVTLKQVGKEDMDILISC